MDNEQLHAWWLSRPDEHYWLEVTGRDDLGADLRAPLKNEQGKSFWSYSLLRFVKAGDVAEIARGAAKAIGKNDDVDDSAEILFVESVKRFGRIGKDF